MALSNSEFKVRVTRQQKSTGECSNKSAISPHIGIRNLWNNHIHKNSSFLPGSSYPIIRKFGVCSSFGIRPEQQLASPYCTDINLPSVAARLTAKKVAQSMRALVVDDNVDAATMLTFLLKALGFEVVAEYHPICALERAKGEEFDLFILDIGLPEMDGHQLARLLQSECNNNDATFIALTGYGSDEDKRRSAEAGFHHHFVKPFDVERFTRIFFC